MLAQARYPIDLIEDSAIKLRCAAQVGI